MINLPYQTVQLKKLHAGQDEDGLVYIYVGDNRSSANFFQRIALFDRF